MIYGAWSSPFEMEELFMRIYQCADYSSMSRKAASIIAAQIQLKPDCVLGLATGSTPVGAYEQLVRWYQAVSYTHLFLDRYSEFQ